MSLAKHTHFFVVAHPDDVELFMFNALVAGLEKSDRLVLVVLTAGDDGQDHQSGSEEAYWYLRDLGHRKAIEYLTDRIQGKVSLKSKTNFGLGVAVANDVHMYNLMLPDQLLEKGSPKTLLSCIDDGEHQAIESIDKKNKYTRPELIEVLKKIYKHHADLLGKSFLHVTDERLDVKDDHLDHQVTTRWAIEAFGGVGNKTESIFRYQTYLNYHAPVNLDYSVALLHAATWGIYNNYIFQVHPDLSGRRQTPYLGKQYLR